ncbi:MULTISPECIES: hypothetical protein [unclassified Sphingomonas]|uniref:hypothetical protein n=1 Tax=unclassified Sphingomonas TaxID=196159 RepID=UPI001F5AED69|nr:MULTISPECIES: hypothetical protein [unclassified Sphingomonas]
MLRLLLPAALLVAGGTAVSADSRGFQERQAAKDQADLAKQLAGLVPGRPQECIQQRNYNDTSRVGDTILYKFNRNDIYRTDTNGGCFGLRRGDAIITKSYTGQLCRGDIIQTVDLVSRVPSGSCTFGPFVRYRKP